MKISDLQVEIVRNQINGKVEFKSMTTRTGVGQFM